VRAPEPQAAARKGAKAVHAGGRKQVALILRERGFEADGQPDDLVGRRPPDTALDIGAGADAGNERARRQVEPVAGGGIGDADPRRVQRRVRGIEPRPHGEHLGEALAGRAVEQGDASSHGGGVSDEQVMHGLGERSVASAAFAPARTGRRDQRDLVDGL
jgi:hypothetical protein